jgi:hypothetical protein
MLQFVTMNIQAADLAWSLGAENVILLDSLAPEPTSFLEIHTKADRFARQFDQYNSSLRRDFLGFSADSLGWDYMNTYQSAAAILSWHRFAPLLVQNLPSAKSIVLLFFKNPIDFCLDSLPIRELLITHLNAKFPSVLVQSLDNGPGFSPDAARFDLRIPEGNFRALSHLPTTFYQSHAERLIDEFGDDLLDLQSPYFDTPIGSSRIMLHVRAENLVQEDPVINRFLQAAKAATDGLFEELGVLNPDTRNLQAMRHAQRSLSQINAYYALQNNASLKLLERVDLACHDGGLMGPVVSWANEMSIPVEVWPHSSVVNIPQPPMWNSRIHGISRKPSRFLHLGLESLNWTDPVIRKSRVKRSSLNILFLFSELQDSGGVPICSLNTLREQLTNIARQLAQQGWTCQVRQKPNLFYPRALNFNSIPEAGGDLEQWIEWPDVCVSLMQPTTALLRFWSAGCDCYHIQEYFISEGEAHMLPEDFICIEGIPLGAAFQRLYSHLTSRNIASMSL